MPDAIVSALLRTDVRNAGAVLQSVCHGLSKAAGWWTDKKTGADETLTKPLEVVGWKLALIHSEVSEATEGFRKDKMDEHLPHRKAAEVELADAAIRIFDLAGAMEFNLGNAIMEKLAYNAQRADHKPDARFAEGGKRF